MRSIGFAQSAGLAPKGPLPASCARRSARARPFRPLSERRRQSDPGLQLVRCCARERLITLLAASGSIALVVFVRPTRAETVDAGKIYVIDGDTVAVARERIRLLGIDAPETREARCERERVAGYRTKARSVDLLRFSQSVDIRRQGHDPYGRTLARIIVRWPRSG